MKNRNLIIVSVIIALIIAAFIFYSLNYSPKTFIIGTLEFSYPQTLTLEKNTYAVTLTHSIPHEHPNACDFKGDAPALKNLTDFSASFKFFAKPMAAVINSNPQSYAASQLTSDGKLTLSPGTVDTYEAGKLKGYKITEGVEGCGQYSYYFPVGTHETLFITRPFVPEFNSINSQSAANLKLPGIIPPAEAEAIFRSILESVK